MDKSSELSDESDRLRRSWERYDTETLDQYLVSDVEDPRINVQSILNRGLLCDTLFPGRFTQIIEEELRFGYVMTWILTQWEQGVDSQTLLAATRGEHRGACSAFLLDTFRRCQRQQWPWSDYVSAALLNHPENGSLGSAVLDMFQEGWRRELEGLTHDGYRLFEPACGSANKSLQWRHSGTSSFSRGVRNGDYQVHASSHSYLLFHSVLDWDPGWPAGGCRANSEHALHGSEQRGGSGLAGRGSDEAV